MRARKKHSLKKAASDPNSSEFHQKISAATVDEINSSLSKKYRDKRNTMFMLAAHHHDEATLNTIAKMGSSVAIGKALRRKNANEQTGLLILALHQGENGFRPVIDKASYRTVTSMLKEKDQSIGGNQDLNFMLVVKHQTHKGFRAIIGKSPKLVQEMYPSVKRAFSKDPTKLDAMEDIEFIIHTHSTAAKNPKHFVDFMVDTLPKVPSKIHDHLEWKAILDTALSVIPNDNKNKKTRDKLLAMSCRVYASALNAQVPIEMKKSHKINMLDITPENISARDNFLIATLMSQQQESYYDANPKIQDRIKYQVKILQHVCEAAHQGYEKATRLLTTHPEKMHDLIELHKERIKYHIDNQGPTYANLFSHTNNSSNYRICKDIIRSSDFDIAMLDDALNSASAAHVTGDKVLIKLLTEMKSDMSSVIALQSKLGLSHKDDLVMSRSSVNL